MNEKMTTLQVLWNTMATQCFATLMNEKMTTLQVLWNTMATQCFATFAVEFNNN